VISVTEIHLHVNGNPYSLVMSDVFLISQLLCFDPQGFVA